LSSERSGRNFEVSMTIDFDRASIPGQNFSFNDYLVEWFAAFNRAINLSALELGVNFAYQDNLATGQGESPHYYWH
jgi:hypothetical protein